MAESTIPVSVDEQLRADLEGLSALPGDGVRELTTLVLTFLLHPKTTNFQEDLGTIAQKVSMNGGAFKVLVRSLLVFLQNGMHEGWQAAELEAKCANISVSPEATAVILEVWKTKTLQMATSLVSRTIKANQLVDLDWKFGATASSDDCNHLGKTFLQLKFTIDTADSGLKNVFMELSLEQFYQFLAQMENCKSYLEFLSSNA